MSDQGFPLSERAEIEEDLERQGLADEVSYEDVQATFGLHRTMKPMSEYGPPPKPAMGEEFRYTPVPGEDDGIFDDTTDMWFPPES